MPPRVINLDYYASGANDEITLRENRAAYERITLLPRMLVGASARARQLDTTPATISILAEIVDAVAGAVEVYVDGGSGVGPTCSKRWLMARGRCW